MKRYKLLKDLPFAKAGEIFQQSMGVRGGKEEPVFISASHITTSLWAKDIKNFDDWFEEINPTWIEHWHITHVGDIIRESNHILREDTSIEDARKEIGNYFATEEDAEKHIEWLKARAILLEDTTKKGMFNVCHNSVEGFKVLKTADVWSEMMFKTEEDAKQSIKSHEKEWKIYFGVEE